MAIVVIRSFFFVAGCLSWVLTTISRGFTKQLTGIKQTLIFQFPIYFGTKLSVANISGN